MRNETTKIGRSVAAVLIVCTLLSEVAFANESSTKIADGLTEEQYVTREAKLQGVTNITSSFRNEVLTNATRSGYKFSYDKVEINDGEQLTESEYIANEARKLHVTNITPAFEQTILQEAWRTGYKFKTPAKKDESQMTQTEYINEQAKKLGLSSTTPAFEQAVLQEAEREGIHFSN